MKKAFGAKVLMPISAQFWGNRWTVATRVKDMTPDEMKKKG